ncbi:MAG: excinuclease ABC subunit UvrC [Acidobacteriota bacterium]|nr:MAG: excinuclease ABC subunit UvrC [Acidobacteriota bacterium]
MEAAQAKTLPAEPGVYLFKDGRGKILYVGKAKNLRARVRSYFTGGAASPRIEKMLRGAADVECVVTDSDVEALGLENNLIKEHRPPYNVLLRDDKTYPYIKITTGEAFPEAVITRRVERDGHGHFGPYIPPASAKRLLRFLHTHFKIRQCTGDISKKRARSCLYYQLHQCDGPCSKLIPKRAYRRQVEDAVMFLRGRRGELAKALLRRMGEASAAMRYEEAANLRDLVRTLETTAPGVQKAATATEKEADVFGFAREAQTRRGRGRRAALHVFVIRGGDIVHHRRFVWKSLDGAPARPGSEAALVETAVSQYYNLTDDVPREVLLPCLPPAHETLEAWLREKRSRLRPRRTALRVRLVVPERGEKKKLLVLAERNARLCLEDPAVALAQETPSEPWAVLGLEAAPQRVDAFDVSHWRGAETVASMVVWKNKKFAKGEYRRYGVREAPASDDLAAMREVIGRRFRRAIEEASEMPDLVLVDGGAGQVGAAREALKEFHLDRLPLVGLAKREELLYFPERREPLHLPRTSPVLRTLQRLRDEAHRFAVAYHRKRRAKRTFQTALTEIPGIGEKRARRLLRIFGSAEAVARAEESALTPVLGKKLARRIREVLK